ncbi:hypothetical protein LEN26_000678 [Aphanomyces euteiches]|uniref:Uncharacterized protein n=1 Tax=Aphanomyces euteiches TaxID=100861 RepID=A0A6G0X866_9STRA|nr:hypothetical protein Ae201684_007243 [Aphanomyces euteiches]KAH9100473.1 hypothetical protein Ae201684P_006670 [Aphanomyces euteiches]KAH9108151.1 hypothetical protein AeMF1_016626 [Aphanomyces euteiches]KAH9119853.1 hypothetical protein AeMF1_007695 [Aphanomyces euteiches]KAH9122816.1 hypothetical protein AeMF1_006054 [Aphanomyces euteiches]
MMDLSFREGLAFGWEENSVDRSSWNDVSDAALRRLEVAKEKFTTFAANPATRDGVYHQVLTPSDHLTEVTWGRFKKYCEECGWLARRRKATEAEKQEARETRKAAVYFVDAKLRHVAVGKRKMMPEVVHTVEKKPRAGAGTKCKQCDREALLKNYGFCGHHRPTSSFYSIVPTGNGDEYIPPVPLAMSRSASNKSNKPQTCKKCDQPALEKNYGFCGVHRVKNSAIVGITV